MPRKEAVKTNINYTYLMNQTNQKLKDAIFGCILSTI